MLVESQDGFIPAPAIVFNLRVRSCLAVSMQVRVLTSERHKAQLCDTVIVMCGEIFPGVDSDFRRHPEKDQFSCFDMVIKSSGVVEQKG